MPTERKRALNTNATSQFDPCVDEVGAKRRKVLPSHGGNASRSAKPGTGATRGRRKLDPLDVPPPPPGRRRAPMFKPRRSKRRLRRRKLKCLPPLTVAPAPGPEHHDASVEVARVAEPKEALGHVASEDADCVWVPLPSLCAPSLPPLVRSLSSPFGDGSAQPLVHRVHISVTPPCRGGALGDSDSVDSDMPHFALSSPEFDGSPCSSLSGDFFSARTPSSTSLCSSDQSVSLSPLILSQAPLTPAPSGLMAPSGLTASSGLMPPSGVTAPSALEAPSGLTMLSALEAPSGLEAVCNTQAYELSPRSQNAKTRDAVTNMCPHPEAPAAAGALPSDMTEVYSCTNRSEYSKSGGANSVQSRLLLSPPYHLDNLSECRVDGRRTCSLASLGIAHESEPTDVTHHGSSFVSGRERDSPLSRESNLLAMARVSSSLDLGRETHPPDTGRGGVSPVVGGLGANRLTARASPHFLRNPAPDESTGEPSASWLQAAREDTGAPPAETSRPIDDGGVSPLFGGLCSNRLTARSSPGFLHDSSPDGSTGEPNASWPQAVREDTGAPPAETSRLICDDSNADAFPPFLSAFDLLSEANASCALSCSSVFLPVVATATVSSIDTEMPGSRRSFRAEGTVPRSHSVAVQTNSTVETPDASASSGSLTAFRLQRGLVNAGTRCPDAISTPLALTERGHIDEVLSPRTTSDLPGAQSSSEDDMSLEITNSKVENIPAESLPQNVSTSSQQGVKSLHSVADPTIQTTLATPLTRQSVASPAIQQSIAAPAISQTLATPVIQQSLSLPAIKQSVTPPGISQSIAAPVISHTLATPAIQQSLSPPTIQQSVTPPGISQSVMPPVISHTLATPAIQQSLSPPAIQQSVTPPGISQSIVSLAIPQSLSPPAIPQSVTPPGISQSLAAPGVPQSSADTEQPSQQSAGSTWKRDPIVAETDVVKASLVSSSRTTVRPRTHPWALARASVCTRPGEDAPNATGEGSDLPHYNARNGATKSSRRQIGNYIKRERSSYNLRPKTLALAAALKIKRSWKQEGASRSHISKPKASTPKRSLLSWSLRPKRSPPSRPPKPKRSPPSGSPKPKRSPLSGSPKPKASAPPRPSSSPSRLASASASALESDRQRRATPGRRSAVTKVREASAEATRASFSEAGIERRSRARRGDCSSESGKARRNTDTTVPCAQNSREGASRLTHACNKEPMPIDDNGDDNGDDAGGDDVGDDGGDDGGDDVALYEVEKIVGKRLVAVSECRQRLCAVHVTDSDSDSDRRSHACGVRVTDSDSDRRSHVCGVHVTDKLTDSDIDRRSHVCDGHVADSDHGRDNDSDRRSYVVTKAEALKKARATAEARSTRATTERGATIEKVNAKVTIEESRASAISAPRRTDAETETEVQYLVKWRGFGADENTWEPEEHLRDVGWAIREFESGNTVDLS